VTYPSCWFCGHSWPRYRVCLHPALMKRNKLFGQTALPWEELGYGEDCEYFTDTMWSPAVSQVQPVGQKKKKKWWRKK